MRDAVIRAHVPGAWDDPGAETVARLWLDALSVVVISDADGGNLYDEVIGPGSEGGYGDVAAIPGQWCLRPNTHCGVGPAPPCCAEARTHHHHLQRVGRIHHHVLHTAGAAADRGRVSRRTCAGWPDPPGSDVRTGVRLAGCRAHRRHHWDSPHDADLWVAPHGAQRSGAAGADVLVPGGAARSARSDRTRHHRCRARVPA